MPLEFLGQFAQFTLVGHQSLLTSIPSASSRKPPIDVEHLPAARYKLLNIIGVGRNTMRAQQEVEQLTRSLQFIYDDGSPQRPAKEGLVALLALHKAPRYATHMISQRRKISKQPI